MLGFGTGLGVFSVPLAVVAGAVVGTVLGGLSRGRHELPMIGPVATSYLLLLGSNLGLLWVLGPFGTAVVSGFSGAYTVQTVMIVPAIALGSATAIVMNQLRGQGRNSLLPNVFRALAAAVTRSRVIAEQVERYLGIVLPTMMLMGSSRCCSTSATSARSWWSAPRWPFPSRRGSEPTSGSRSAGGHLTFVPYWPVRHSVRTGHHGAL